MYHNLHEDELLSVKSKTGETAFSRACTKSIKISKFILARDVNVATIDSSFLTPQFYHEELVLDMLLKGINPKGLDSNKIAYCFNNREIYLESI